MPTYILLKDLHEAKAGSEYIFITGGKNDGTVLFRSKENIEKEIVSYDNSVYPKEFIQTDKEYFKIREYETFPLGMVFIHTVQRSSDSEKFSIGDAIYDGSFKEQVIKSFKQSNSFGDGIEVVCEKSEGHCSCSLSSISHISKVTEQDKEIFNAKKLLLANDFTLKTKNSVSAQITTQSHYFLWGEPPIIINGEGYMPIKEHLDAMNRKETIIKVDENEIQKSVTILNSAGYETIDTRKKYTEEDMRKCFNDAIQFGIKDGGRLMGANHPTNFDEYLKSLDK